MTRRSETRLRTSARLFSEVLDLAGRHGWKTPRVQTARRAAFEGLRSMLELGRRPVELTVTSRRLEVAGRPFWAPDGSVAPRRLHDSGVRALVLSPGLDSGQFCRLLRWLDALNGPMPAGEGPVTMLWSLSMKDVEVRLRETPPAPGARDDELGALARAADRRLDALAPRRSDAAGGPPDGAPRRGASREGTDKGGENGAEETSRDLGLVSDELAEDMAGRLESEHTNWQEPFGQMMGTLWQEARREDDEEAMRATLRRFTDSSLRMGRAARVVEAIARALSLFDDRERRADFAADALTPSLAARLFEALLPTPEAPASPEELQHLNRLSELVGCLPATFGEVVHRAFFETNARGRKCLLGFLRRDFQRDAAALQERIAGAATDAAVDLLDETLRHRGEEARALLRAALDHPDGEVRVHALECLEFAPMDLAAPLTDVSNAARARARHEVLEIAQTRRRSDLIAELCDRTSDRNFQHRPLAKRAALLEALAAAAPERAVDVATRWIERFDLFPSRDLTDTRVMAARLLEAVGADGKALEALDRAASHWWWNPKLLRKQARSTADKLRAGR